jgi:hypothetical protein
MAKLKYEQVYDGEWIRPTDDKNHKMRCCDCGLVHVFEFRFRKGRVEFKAFRDNRATANSRRKKL